MIRHLTSLPVIASLAFAPAAGLVRHAGADVVTAQWNNNTSFSYEITHMPDLDQRRAAAPGILGLPNDGSMYCVPTSTLNMMMYAANHGFPSILPGAANWQSNDLYNAATLNIFAMGLLMETHPVNGTGGLWHSGAKAWLNQSGDLGKFTVELKYHTGALGPNLNSLAKAGINGHLVSLSYGTYTYLGKYEGLPMYKRTGGHIVTMAKAHRDGFEQTLWVRDPADDFDKTSQSKFVNLKSDIQNKVVYARINGEPELRFFSALDYTEPPSKARFIDGALYIRPRAGYSFTKTGGNWKIAQFSPWKFVGTSPAPSDYTLDIPGEFVHGAINASGTEAFAISEIPGAPNRIFAVDLLTEQIDALAEFPSASHLALSPKGQLYVLTPSILHCIDLMDPEKPVQSAELPFPGSAMVFDSFHNKLVILSVENKLLMHFAGLMPSAITHLPGTAPLEGKGVVGVCPMTGMYWFGSQASNTLFGMGISDTGAPIFEFAMAPGLNNPTSFDFDDDGHLFITDGTSLVEMQKTAFAGWQPVMNSAFAGMNVGPVFKMARSETNFDPELHTGFSYFNIDPADLTFGEVVFDCYADLTKTGSVGVADLLYLLGSWGSCTDGPCPADLTGNRMVGVADLLQLLGAWGPCP